MAFLDADIGSISRCLHLVSKDPDAIVDCYFERSEECELASGSSRGLQVLREEGFSVRLLADGVAFLVSRDRIDGEVFLEALRRTARRMTQGMIPSPRLGSTDWPERTGDDEMAAFPGAVERNLRRRQLVFPHGLRIRRHRRWIQVVGPELVGGVEEEDYYSVRANLEGARWGSLLPAVDEAAAERVASALGSLFRARGADPPTAGRQDLVLGPSAAAVLLHEAAAHALEVDTLALTGAPESAVGFPFASEAVDLLDDPSGGPPALQRATDDEGMPVLRRWLLRRGIIEQLLADRRWALLSPSVMPGAARRQSRHFAPGPRSHHLELLPGDTPARELVAGAGDGLYASEAVRGRLDPSTGSFELSFRHGRRLRGGKLEGRVGPFSLRGKVSLVLGKIAAVASEPTLSGAGWCAKGGQKLPVWSTTPSILLEGVEVLTGAR